MPAARARPLRLRLLLLAASGLLPLVIVLAWGLNHLVDERRVHAERSVLELSRALATAVDAELRSIATVLQEMGTSDALEQADLRTFHMAARRTADELGWRHVALSDAEGRVLLRSSEPYGTSNPAPLDPESVARVIQSQAPAVSRVVSTPQFKSDAFAVRIPVLRSGKLVYVLSAVLPVDAVLRVLTRQEIPSGSVASVFDQTYHRVARSRPTASPLPTSSLRELLDKGEAQGVGRTITREGGENYSGYTRLRDSGWTVVVGRSVDEVNQGLYALLRAVALGLAASLGLSVLLAWALSRRVLGPIDALKSGAAALGRGDPVQLPPLAIIELDDVAVALAEAAADRDRSAQERDRSIREREHAAAERERLAGQIADALRIAEEANRSKDQFLAMLGHELRNPLAPITTALRLMELKGDERTAKERRVIGRQLVHVTRLVDDLLDVSRITGHRLSIRRVPVRLGEVLAHVVDAVRPSLDQRSLALELGPGMDQAWVMGDEVRLVQVFNNLLVNAIKFTRTGESIRVSAALSGHEVQVDVLDEGMGIAAGDVERIFELFYQAPQNSDRARGGLGLGLPIVKSLVEMHGGSVHAASDGVGRGSCLTVRLPLCETPATSQPAALEPAARGAGRILVVDDNRDAADTLSTLLEMSGYDVRVAYTPQAALETLRHYTPDVAILDIGLPGMSGYALAGLMKAPPIGYSGRLVALTGYGQAGDRAASREAGFDVHLTKPVSPETLLEVVEKLSSSTGTLS